MEAIVPLLAFGFGNLALLGWLAAAAAPILIHLWNKRKYREHRWAAIEFLLVAMRRNARRIQLMQWLLLAVRTLIIVLIVLAMAEPYFEQLGLGFVAGKRTHRVIVIDGSFSMGYHPTDASRFDRAKALAAQIVDESRQGDGFTLVLMSRPAQVIVGSPAFQPEEFIDEIQSLELPHTGGDLVGAVAHVEEIVDRAAKSEPALERNEVFFLTDLGRTSWIAGAASEGGQFRQQVRALGRRAALNVLDLGQSGSDNVAITKLESAEPFATLWRDVTLEVQVRNFGNQARTQYPVSFFVDDVRIGEERIDLEPGGEASLSFTHRFDTPGHHRIEARLAADLLPIDDSRWLAVEVKPQLKTLIVQGKQGAADYLVDALDPDRNERSLTTPQVVPESALVELNLDEYDCVFLCNVGQFTSGEAKLLEAYLKQGGGLVVFLGDRVLAERYNRELAGLEEGSVRVLPARLGEIAAEASYELDPLGYKHPILRPFAGNEQAGLRTTPIFRYFKLTVPEAWKESRTALALVGGDPAIVESPLHAGRSILVATAASLASEDARTGGRWTLMPAWPTFLPLVQEMLALAVGSQAEQYNGQVGETLGGLFPATASAGDISLSPPGEKTSATPVSIEPGVEGARWSYDRTLTSGVYEVKFSPPNARTELYALNVDTAESDLAKADPSDLPPEFSLLTDWQNLDERPATQIGRQSGLATYLLYGALALLFVEMYLAWRFGRGVA